jgi:hypothetical protein
MKFNSKSEEIKFYVQELLADGQEHTREEIKEYVTKRAGHNNFTEGNFAGSLYDLVQRNKIKSVRRGIYRLAEFTNFSISQDVNSKDHDVQKKKLNNQCISILNNAIMELRNAANEIDILDVNEEELRVIALIKEVISSLQQNIKLFEK